MTTIYIYENLSAAAVRCGLEGPHLAFVLIKHYARTHQGRQFLNTAQFCAILAEYGISERRALRYLKLGEGVYWFFHHRGRDRREKYYHVWSYDVVCLFYMENDGDQTLPGKAYKLPVTAYGDLDEFIAPAAGAWILAHPHSTRGTQEKALHRAPRNIRKMQQRAAVRQQQRGVIAPKPETPAEAAELDTQIGYDGDGKPDHVWYGPGDTTYYQISNFYHGGLAVDLGWKRAGFIRSHVKRGPVYRGRESGRTSAGPNSTPARTQPATFEQSYEPTAAVRAYKYQTHYPDRLTLAYFGDMPNARPRPTAIIQGPRLRGYHLNYSLNAQQQGVNCA